MKLGPATQALVSGCAPRALTARGAWEAGTDYLAEDVVSAKGTSWRAKRGSIGSPPAAGSLDWEQFAAKTNPLGSGSGPDDVGAADAPTGPAGGDLTGTYPNPQIANLAITSNKIANDAVTTSKIPLLAITSNRLANDAITTSKFQNQSVTNAKLALDAVSTERILDATITAADLGANSVGQSEIQTNGVAATEIADNSIDSGEIVDNSLFSIDLAADSVRGSELGTINRRSATSGVIAGNGTGNIGVQCLAGERVLAGGNDASSATNIVIVASRNDGANGWRVFARNLAAGNQTVTVHAYCLEAS